MSVILAFTPNTDRARFIIYDDACARARTLRDNNNENNTFRRDVSPFRVRTTLATNF